jgi:hypothetical protein
VQTDERLDEEYHGRHAVSVQAKGCDIRHDEDPAGRGRHVPAATLRSGFGRGLSINGGNCRTRTRRLTACRSAKKAATARRTSPRIRRDWRGQRITSGYTAENGRQSSGLISIVTKSGTNQYRGSAWYNARRDEWNKNEYFRIKVVRRRRSSK